MMLETVKQKGELVAAQRLTEDSRYIEGTVQKVLVDGDDYFYEIAWEDGEHFGEIFYEGELDEIDLEESEAIIRVALSEFFSEEGLDDWLYEENRRLKGLSPLDALQVLGLKRVAAAAVDDYGYALIDDDDDEDPLEEDVLEDQLGAILGSKAPKGSV